jgi:hypothetical protein
MQIQSGDFKKNWQRRQRKLHKSGADCAYLYAHLEADTGEIFYIGMGETPGRPWSLGDRTNKHKNRIKKHGVKVEIITEPHMKWELAGWWECWWIAACRAAGFDLVNLTDGGDDQPMRHPEVIAKHLENVPRGDAHYTKNPLTPSPMTLPHVKLAHLEATQSDEFREIQRERIRTEGNPMDRDGVREKHLDSVRSESFKNKQRDRLAIEGHILDRPGARENHKAVISSPEYKAKKLESAPRGDTHYMASSPEKAAEAGARLVEFLTPQIRSDNAKKGWETRRRNQLFKKGVD